MHEPDQEERCAVIQNVSPRREVQVAPSQPYCRKKHSTTECLKHCSPSLREVANGKNRCSTAYRNLSGCPQYLQLLQQIRPKEQFFTVSDDHHGCHGEQDERQPGIPCQLLENHMRSMVCPTVSEPRNCLNGDGQHNENQRCSCGDPRCGQPRERSPFPVAFPREHHVTPVTNIENIQYYDNYDDVSKYQTRKETRKGGPPGGNAHSTGDKRQKDENFTDFPRGGHHKASMKMKKWNVYTINLY